MKHLIILAALAATGAFAQTTSQGQSSQVSGQSIAAVESGAVQIISNDAVQPTTTTVKTTGNAIAPGIYNSSGGYNCGGGTSLAAGGPGWAFGGGSSRELSGCLGLYRMDKAAGRANAAMRASQDEKLDMLERVKYAQQAEAFSRVWDAEYCALDGGADAYKRAGLECPQ